MRLAPSLSLSISLAIAIALAACGGGPARRGDFLVNGPSERLSVHLTYTSAVRLGSGRVAGGLVRVESHTDRALTLEVLCIARPEVDGIIPDEVAAVLRSNPIDVEPMGTTELFDVFFAGGVPPASPGPYQVECGVRERGETGLFLFPGISSSGLQGFARRDPDLFLGVARSTADVYDCETEALPVRGRALCVQPTISGGELRTEMLMPELDQHTVRCELGGITREIVADTTALYGHPTLRFEDTAALPPGPLDVTCTIDPDDVLTESDETNNTVALTTTLLADQSGWSTTVRVVASEASARFHESSGETGARGSWDFRMPFILSGHPIREGTASCASADGLTATGSFGMGGLPENIVLAGEHSLPVTFTTQPTPGDHVLTCALTVTTPAALHVESSSAEVTVLVAP